jgi:sugar lactone lactonase YvrE
MTLGLQALPAPPALLGESPFWHPDEAALYWCDIPGQGTAPLASKRPRSIASGP